ncbi:hypothetical protein FIC94_22220 [Ochrobactrum teleogrylli]|uniref:Type IV secretory system conjugative DNA transfer family protein n=1 Tax=Ochrobactrum teleogrylli TaxID=2479765 RepID=A0ABY2XZE2_9HYPH|nr:hypothetical protein FIC94_22220 [[Ochrobactrum] teleogrylli]
MGQRVYRFGPRDFDMPSHRFNPLQRIGKIKNPAQRMSELEKLATLFLTATSSQAESFLPNSRGVFIACAVLAYERGNFTLGYIYKLINGGELGNNDKFARYAEEVKDPAAKVLLQKFSNTAKDTLSAYISILDSSGFSPWANAHTCAVTAAHDFNFSDFRRTPCTVYFTCPYEDLKTIAPLVRMFFSELIATLQLKEPGPDEPFPVMILLDEFQRIGCMPIIVDSMSLLRSYGGNVAVITQSIADLDRVYSVEDRKAIQANSGIKLFLTPAEKDTISEVSEAVGTTTKKVVSRSKTLRDGVMGTNISERTEEYPLLTKDDARRLPMDEIVIVVDGGMPIRAKRLMYFADKVLRKLYNAQDFKSPPPMPTYTITEADYEAPGSVAAEEVPQQDLQAQKDKLHSGKSLADQLIARRVAQRVEEGKETPLPQLDALRIPANIDPDAVAAVSNNIADLFKQAQLIAEDGI